MSAHCDALEAVAVWLQADKKGKSATGVEPALRLWNAKSIATALHSLGRVAAIDLCEPTQQASPRKSGISGYCVNQVLFKAQSNQLS